MVYRLTRGCGISGSEIAVVQERIGPPSRRFQNIHAKDEAAKPRRQNQYRIVPPAFRTLIVRHATKQTTLAHYLRARNTHLPRRAWDGHHFPRRPGRTKASTTTLMLGGSEENEREMFVLCVLDSDTF
jgi:hypothetical protein